MTIKESYELGELLKILVSQEEVTIHTTIVLSRYFDKHTPKTFDPFHWFQFVNKK